MFMKLINQSPFCICAAQTAILDDLAAIKYHYAAREPTSWKKKKLSGAKMEKAHLSPLSEGHEEVRGYHKPAPRSKQGPEPMT